MNSRVQVSIIIPLYNAYSYTRSCLESLYASFNQANHGSPGCDYEVILVDNASYDETPNEASKLDYPKLSYHRLETNQGFAKGCNFGARQATGEYLIFLNNDTIVFPGALDVLVGAIRANDAIGMVGSRLLYPDYTVQHAGMAIDENLDWAHVFRGFPAEHPFVLQRRAMSAVTAACCIISKALFDQLGGFDEEFWNSHEDVDLCLRVRETGKEVIYEPTSVLLHYESMTEGRTATHVDPSHERFKEKWRDKVTPDLESQTRIFVEKLHSRLEHELQRQREHGDSYANTPYDDWQSQAPTRAFHQLLQDQLMVQQHIQLEKRTAELDTVSQLQSNNPVVSVVRWFRRVFSP